MTLAHARHPAHRAARDTLHTPLMAMRPDGVEHGTEWTYRVKRCRCPECRQAKSRGR